MKSRPAPPPDAGPHERASGGPPGTDVESSREAALQPVLAGCLYSRGLISAAQAAQLAGTTEAEFAAAVATANEAARGARADPAVSLDLPELPPGFLLSVLMPVYNEQATVLEIIRRVRLQGIPVELLVVDDGSTDGTRDLLREEVEDRLAGVRVFYQDRNRGKGAAVRRAIGEVTGDICVIQDADVEYDPREYGRLLEPILDGRADAVFGSRFIGGGPHRVHLYWHYLGNTILTTLSNILTNLNLTDMETCYKVVKTDLLRSLPLRASGFEIEPELTARLARAGARIYEVPISYSGRSYLEGKKIGWWDGVKAMVWIVRSRFR